MAFLSKNTFAYGWLISEIKKNPEDPYFRIKALYYYIVNNGNVICISFPLYWPCTSSSF